MFARKSAAQVWEGGLCTWLAVAAVLLGVCDSRGLSRVFLPLYGGLVIIVVPAAGHCSVVVSPRFPAPRLRDSSPIYPTFPSSPSFLVSTVLGSVLLMHASVVRVCVALVAHGFSHVLSATCGAGVSLVQLLLLVVLLHCVLSCLCGFMPIAWWREEFLA